MRSVTEASVTSLDNEETRVRHGGRVSDIDYLLPIQ